MAVKTAFIELLLVTYSILQPLLISTCQAYRAAVTRVDLVEGQYCNNKLEEFDWEKITPQKILVWHTCSEDHQCARLSVPLNYSVPDAGAAVIALIRKPALVSTSSPDYRGPILFNPGGPGNSGVDFIQRTADAYSKIVGPQFDIVGFDPRGIGRSLPRASFYRTAAERTLAESQDVSVINSSANDVTYAWARAQIIGQLAIERDDGGLFYINTEQTAHDMLAIVKAHGRDKLQYWGFSYGTVLGATFAALFPTKVERLVIDGVMDAEDYYATRWINNLFDTEKTMQTFVDGCIVAGPEACAFYSPSAEKINENLTMLYERLLLQPMPIRTHASYGILDYKRMRSTIFSSLYKPQVSFPELAKALSDLAAGNGTRLFQINERPGFDCSCKSSANDYPYIRDATDAIICNDGVSVTGTIDDAQKHFNKMEKESPWADVWATWTLDCYGWPKTPETFRGPFIANTSFPLLLVGNTADPVTPLASAKKMSGGFNGSIVLTQDSPGHCSFAAPSLCTQKHIRNYFVHGRLPEEGTVCAVEGTLFSTVIAAETDARQTVFEDEMNKDDESILDAIRIITRNFPLPFVR